MKDKLTALKEFLEENATNQAGWKRKDLEHNAANQHDVNKALEADSQQLLRPKQTK